MLDACYHYACQWRFKFNPNKSVVMIFNKRHNSHQHGEAKFSIGGNEINSVNQTDHLGIKLDLNFNL